MMKASDILPPSSDVNIVEVVKQWVDKHYPNGTRFFQHYDDALKAVWPALFKDSPGAAIFLSIETYLEIAEEKGFQVEPSYLKRAQAEGLFM